MRTGVYGVRSYAAAGIGAADRHEVTWTGPDGRTFVLTSHRSAEIATKRAAMMRAQLGTIARDQAHREWIAAERAADDASRRERRRMCSDMYRGMCR